MTKTNLAVAEPQDGHYQERRRRWGKLARWRKIRSGNWACEIDGIRYFIFKRTQRQISGVMLPARPWIWRVNDKAFTPESFVTMAEAKAAACQDYCQRTDRAQQAAEASTQSPAPTPEPEWRIGFDEVLD